MHSSDAKTPSKAISAKHQAKAYKTPNAVPKLAIISRNQNANAASKNHSSETSKPANATNTPVPTKVDATRPAPRPVDSCSVGLGRGAIGVIVGRWCVPAVRTERVVQEPVSDAVAFP
jgi:hypothetical protein